MKTETVVFAAFHPPQYNQDIIGYLKTYKIE